VKLRYLWWCLLPLTGCTPDEAGVQQPAWDRSTCERCRMVLSDRHFAAQVHYLPGDTAYPRVAWFDDIGCALLWLEDKPWKDAPDTRVWVADYHSGDWLDARKAFYASQANSPMAYNLGAGAEPSAGALDFAAAATAVRASEHRARAQAARLEARFNQQARQRAQSRLPAQALPATTPVTRP
jgi:copper chaperone NosL